MKPIYRSCADLDVHKKFVSVCVRRRAHGKPDMEMEEAVFGTFTLDLERLSKWLRQRKVECVAMESTGVYRIPVWNVLESAGRLKLILVNPANVRALHGQKTDRIDARCIAEFPRYGLLRAHVQHDRNRVINRMAGLLETVSIKLGAVASQIAGKSGLAMPRRIAEGGASIDARLAGQMAPHEDALRAWRRFRA